MKKIGVTKLAKQVTATIMAVGMSLSAGCAVGGENSASDSGSSSTPPPLVEAWQTQTTGKIVERPVYVGADKKELLRDLNFSKGFNVTLFHSNSSNGHLAGALTHGEEKADGDPVWQMAQWGCLKDMATEHTYTRDGSVLTYEDGGKYMKMDVAKTGNIELGIKGSVEYPLDEEGNIRDRLSATENWPHILIEQSVNHQISANAEHLYMEIDYAVEECTSLVNRELYPEDPNMHAAQFQWFITLADVDETSESYGQAMWFGFSMFDTRAVGDTPSGFSSYDGGKEDSTGLFIYMPSLKQAEQNYPGTANLPSAVVGKNVSVKFDILPFLKQALKVARQHGALKGASVEKLKIGSTNIGWELPGNYDTKVKISHLNMYETY